MNVLPTTPSRTVSSPKSAGRQWHRKPMNFLILVAVVAIIALFVRAEQQRRSVAKELEKTSAELEQIRHSTQGSGEELARQVLEKVRRHMVVPENPKPTVATIIDIEKLKQANEFYQNAVNGDHLIITDRRAILYSPDQDLILDVVPVRIDRTASPSAAPVSSAAPSLPPAVSPSPLPNP